ncbi:10556_t:CDS:1, partial [Paraglomus occultum]
TLTSASTDDDTVGNGQSMNDKMSSSPSKQSKEKIKSHTPNPFKLLGRFSRSLHNDVSKLPEGGISKSDISMPFNQRSLTRPIESADADYNDYDHPESVMTSPDSITARALVNELRRSSALASEGNDSNKLGISSNLLADLFRRRETVGGRRSSPLKFDEKGEDTAKDNISRNGDKGKRTVWDDNDTANNSSAEIDIVVDSGIYDDDRNRGDSNNIQSDKQNKHGQSNETGSDSSIFYDPFHDQTRFVNSESPSSN